MTPRRRFWHVAGAGAAFQAGSSAVDSSTIFAGLVLQLTGSALAVGAVPVILRLGWLLPQLVVGHLAGQGKSSMPFYAIGAFGRSAAIATLAITLWTGRSWGWSSELIAISTFLLWTAYAFLSGVVGVPYNDIVARSVPSDLRSRVLAWRFFGGGVAAIGVAMIADQLLLEFEFPLSYAAILGLAACLMLFSSIVFVSMGEPLQPATIKVTDNFVGYLRKGIDVFRTDMAFRGFVFAQWSGGLVLMAAPFYIMAAEMTGAGLQNLGLYLAAQTAGALAGNPLWGLWGDKLGKISLMRLIAVVRPLPPLLLLGILAFPAEISVSPTLFSVAFFCLGAITNGLTIGVIGLLMEISPDHLRPAYSGYFNAMTAPAFLFPLAGGALVVFAGVETVFGVSAAAAIVQAALLFRIRL